jgi:hypothetical protein
MNAANHPKKSRFLQKTHGKSSDHAIFARDERKDSELSNQTTKNPATPSYSTYD